MIEYFSLCNLYVCNCVYVLFIPWLLSGVINDNNKSAIVLLTCVVPQDNGGKPISHYVVEKKDKKSGRWTPVSKFCRTPECDVTGLEEGEEYEFRVAAVNDQGQSDPLVTLKPIIAKHPFGTHGIRAFRLIRFVMTFYTVCYAFKPALAK